VVLKPLLSKEKVSPLPTPEANVLVVFRNTTEPDPSNGIAVPVVVEPSGGMELKFQYVMTCAPIDPVAPSNKINSAITFI
jgi:hypothetical protein